MKAIYDNETDSKTERRLGADRRRWNCKHDFPYVDSHGDLVVNNRRKQKDRRLSQDKIKASR